MINEVYIIGKIATEIKNVSKTENPMVIFNVVTWEKQKDKQPKSDFHTIVCYGSSADNLIKYGKKGMQVHVHGKIEYTKLESGTKAQIKAKNVLFLGGKNESDVA